MVRNSIGWILRAAWSVAASSALIPAGVKADVQDRVFKEFTNTRCGYAVEYPAGWRLEVSGDRFAVASYPASRAIREFGVPPGEAEIIVLVPEEIRPAARPKDLEEWATSSTEHQSVAGRRNLDVETGRGKQPVIEVTTRCCLSPPFVEAVEWFLQVGKRMFSVTLVHWEGDGNLERLRMLLQHVALSIRLTLPQVGVDRQ